MLKSQLAELKKEKKFWETNKNIDFDQVNMKVTLSDPFFKVGGDHVAYLEHSVMSRFSVFELEGFSSLRKEQRRKVHQTTKNLNILNTNGSLTEEFKKNLFPHSKNSSMVVRKPKDKISEGSVNDKYSFPKKM